MTTRRPRDAHGLPNPSPKNQNRQKMGPHWAPDTLGTIVVHGSAKRAIITQTPPRSPPNYSPSCTLRHGCHLGGLRKVSSPTAVGWRPKPKKLRIAECSCRAKKHYERRVCPHPTHPHQIFVAHQRHCVIFIEHMKEKNIFHWITTFI